MSYALLWYLAGVLGSIKVFLAVVFSVWAVAYIGVGIDYLNSYGDRERECVKVLLSRKNFIAPLILLVSLFLPSETTSKELIAIYLGEKVITSEPIGELAVDAKEALQGLLEQYKVKEETKDEMQ